MSKRYAEENYITEREEEAIEYAERVIDNETGWNITQPYSGDE